MKTVLQQATEEINIIADSLPLSAGYYAAGMKSAVSILRTYLETEKQQIAFAHSEGMICICDLIKANLKIDLSDTYKEIEKVRNGEPDDKSLDYYSQTFNTNS